MKRNFIVLIILFVVLSVASRVYAVTAAPNKTNIAAEILSVQTIDSSSNFASNYVKILTIKVVTKENVEGSFSIPDKLQAYVHKWTNDLTIVDKLQVGQLITATMSYFGDERGGMWDIRDIKISAKISGSIQHNLYMGLQNSEVIVLQQKLQELGFFPSTLQPTGYFGIVTKKAVQSFQKTNGVSATGYVGSLTRSALAN